jgi:hypothetical protein
MLSKRRFNPILPVLSFARNVVYEMFFEAVNLRLYTVKVTSTVQRYEVRNNKPVCKGL